MFVKGILATELRTTRSAKRVCAKTLRAKKYCNKYSSLKIYPTILQYIEYEKVGSVQTCIADRDLSWQDPVPAFQNVPIILTFFIKQILVIPW